ncbi:MAG: site-specific integrase [Gammaproteobacteria bacterium]|nr:site-specific integrase [Gammaproteobacteria bacterium]
MSRRKKTSYPGVFYRESKRIGGKGTEKVYYIVFKKDGKVYEEKAGRQYADDMTPARTACIRAERIEGKRLSRKEIRQQRDEKKTAEANKWTLDRLFNEYMSTRPGNKSKTTDQNRYENHLQPVFGNTEPCKIDPLSVDRLRIKLLKKLSPQTVKHVLNLFTWTVNFGVKKNLCKGLSFHVQKPSVSNAKTEDLTPEQLKRLIDAIDKDENIQAQNLMRMALYTGMRRGELFKLKWRDIDSPHGFICIRDPKGGVDQTIPLNDAAREVLRNHIKTDSPFVFPGRNGQERKAISKQVNRIKKRAGLPKDFRPLHGLRHVFASMLASSGKVDMYTLQKLLTHKDPRMTQRYAHLRDETLKKASNLAGDIINQVVQQNDNVVGFENIKKKG